MINSFKNKTPSKLIKLTRGFQERNFFNEKTSSSCLLVLSTQNITYTNYYSEKFIYRRLCRRFKRIVCIKKPLISLFNLLRALVELLTELISSVWSHEVSINIITKAGYYAEKIYLSMRALN